MEKQHFSILFTIIGLLSLSHGCTIDGINWFEPETREILDTFRGNVFTSQTQDIQAINSVTQGEGLNKGPYITVKLENSILNIETNSAFENYENIETETIIRYTIMLRCTDSTTRTLIFIINVKDTNNNDPVFLPTNNYEFTIAPPVPPGFVVTTCLNDILVRDIDLTTKRIDFEIEGSDLFEISFDPSSQVAKEFKATLKTTNLIRSIAEPIKLTVTATDVDLTEGPPRTAKATVVINADSQFQFPDEPIFSQPFYLANYKSDNEIILQDKIFLRQGYDGLVKFSFESDYSEYFDFVINQNDLSFNMKAPIPVELYDEKQIYLIVKATREHTSGATSTVIVKLPEDTRLEFENAIYEGTITDNVLLLTELKLKQGYEGFNITVDIESEYAFKANVESNVIKITMDPLATDVIENNNFINLQITASNNRTTAVAVVILEIIKNDYTTPIFEYNFYSGSYSTETGLTLRQIILTQGFDDTVRITLEGEHSKYFKIEQDGPKITLTSSTIPTDIFNERNIMITVLASKPRTVGAHATVNIELPSARYLDFEKNIYEGNIENNDLTLSNIVLTNGYSSDVNFTLEGEFRTYFSIKENENILTIEIEKVIPENILLENDILVLTLSAVGIHAVPTSTSIVLQIIKEDHQTPMFSENLYSFKYENDELNSGNIALVQGFDETVTFDLIGDHKEYFGLEPSPNLIKLILKSSIPEDVIFNNKVIILNIVARKPRTVGANAAIYITFTQEMIEPTVMSFTQNAYKGLIEGSSLTVDDIVLETGYTPQTEFILSGEYSKYFSLLNSSNVIKLTPVSDMSLEDLEDNNFITLDVKAIRERAISATAVVVIDILKTVIVPPVFEKAFYTGTFTSSKGLLFDELISLEKGFDTTVEFSLEEEFSKWFTLEQNDSSVNLKVNATNPIPEEILENNSHLFFTVIASKPGAITGRAVIYIDLPKEQSIPTILQFEKRQYLGNIENHIIGLENIRLMDADISLVDFDLTGEFSKYFTISKLADGIIVGHEELPEEVIENNTVIMLNVEASTIGAISGHATIVLEIIRNEEEIVVPIFEKPFYTGQYSKESGLVFSSTIQLEQGFDKTVTFGLIEEDAKWFSLVHNGPNDLSLRLEDEGLNEITDRSNLVFTVVANKINSPPARSAVIISLKENNDLRVLEFEQKTYVGRIEKQILHIENLRLLEENILSTEFTITGDYSSYFTISKNSDFIQINLLEPPSEMIEDNDFVILNLEASELGAISGHTTIVVKIVKDEITIKEPIFSEIYYTGEYSQESKLIFPSLITLTQGYDETVSFELEDDDSQWFSLVQDVPNTLTLTIKNDNINDIADRSHLIFTVAAHKVDSPSAHAAIVISLVDNSNIRILKFEQTNYLGNLENEMLDIEEIRLLNGITSSMEFSIIGDYASYFSISKLADSIKINLIEFSTELTENNDFIILNLKVSEPGAVSGSTTIVVNIVNNEENNTVTPVFSEAYYTGQYSKENGLIFLSIITLIQGYDETVTFTLDNEDSKEFALIKNGLNNFSLILNGSISEEEIRNYLLFTVIADKPNTNTGRAAIVISLTEPPEIVNESFDKILYNGKLDNGVLSHDKITLSGFVGTNIQITGEHSALFKPELTNGVVKIEATGVEFPKDLTYILLELQAASAKAILLIDVSFSENEDVSFDRTLYNGKLDNGVLSHDKITLSGFVGTNIQITGEHNALFKSEFTNGVVKVEPSGVQIPTDLTYILLELQAATASAKLLIDVSFSGNEDVSFDRILYNGKLDNGVLSHDQITLSGFVGTNIEITGEHNALFKSELTNGVVKVEPSGVQIPTDLTYILLELQAATAKAILLIDVSFSGNEDVSFDRILYNGKLDNGVLSHDKITLSGFVGTNIQITGEHNALFKSELLNGVVKVEPSGVQIPTDLTYILLDLQAATASAKLLIDVSFSGNEDVSFDRILYNGKLDNGVLSHDQITLSGFVGTNIEITGEHNALFKSELTNGVVKVEPSGVQIPTDLTYILLELQAATAKAILLIDVSFSGNEDVSFDRILYNGKLDNGVLSHDKITLSGFVGTNIQITGEHNALFKSELLNGVVKVEPSGVQIPTDLTYILLELQAATASAKLLIDVSFSGNEDVSFDRILYNGKLDNGVLSHDQITLSGFVGTNIEITGEHSALFKSELTNGVVKVETSGVQIPTDLTYILLELQAATAKAILLIDVSFSGNEDVSFDRILYNGKLDNGVLSHDKITLSGFVGTNIQITGEHNALFKSELLNGVVKVEPSGVQIPTDLTYILLDLQAATASAKLLIDVSFSGNEDVSFDRILYNGKLDNGVLSHDQITLSGFVGTNIEITGEHSALFKSELTNGVVKVEPSGVQIPTDLTYILLELQAATASAKLLIDVSFSGNEDVSFDRILYNGKLDNGVLSHDQITLSGFVGTNIEITGEHSALFKSELTNGVVKVEPSGVQIPTDLTYILLELQAATAKAILLIDVSFSGNEDVSFDRILYNGKLDNGVLSHDQITLSGFVGTNIEITGEHSALFKSELTNGVVKVETSGVQIPTDLTYILLELQAATAKAILLIDVSFSGNEDVSFDRILYNGKLDNGVLSHDKITLSGFVGTNIQITGEHNALFKSELLNGVVKVEPSGVQIPTDLTYILLDLQAATASAKLLIDVSFSGNEDVSFDRILYNGKLDNGVLSHDQITLSGFVGTNIEITGEHSALFKSELTNGVVKVEPSGVQIPTDLTYILLELQAATASAKLLIDVSFSGNEDVSFDRILYNGKLDNGVLSHDQITLSGFVGTNIEITGEHSALFKSEFTNGVVKVEPSGVQIPTDLTYILLELQAATAKAILLIDVSFSGNEDVSFDRILYNGKLDNGVLSHDQITLSGFVGTNIEITGEHSALFKSELTNGVVKVEPSGVQIPTDLTYILLELQAATAKAILLIDVSFSENPQAPIVSFKSQSYFLWADVQQTGVVGAVEATADNGEAIIYSLSDHIQNQISINSNGEIYLTATFDKGVYKFNAVATSVQSQVQATAPVLLRVDTVPECSNEVGLSPLIILERLEEEPHLNLVVLNHIEHKGCQYMLTNVFPKDQSWLYVDNDGLHTKAIDREDGSIAFMTLSQIQVELTLECDSDEVPAFAKRSLSTEEKSDLYSYDDGPNKWVLTDTIQFNARRSFVNLIVKDINDNSPIFLGKGNEPIYVGYPVSDLEGTVLPRALAELKATDADIGENAAIMYWSQEDNLAVSPSTGLVHVRNNAQLENNSRLTIYAIDENGKGRNGTIDIVVKLLDKNQIIVLTVRDAFLEDEVDVVNELSIAVGYEIKILRAVVIPNNNEELSRRKRDVESNSQASLQLYAYGLLESEPVDINQLTRDINDINIATVNIASIVSLEDHLEGLEICPAPGRDPGLLAATIVLAVLLFIAIVAIAVRFFLKWKTIKNYKQFSNRSSSVSQLPPANLPKIEVVPKLRPDEIKRTERRLQEMLDTPIEKAPVRQASDDVKPSIKTVDDTLVNISTSDAELPIVIQSIDKLKDKTDESDDNDEFGEVKKPRKSVVTFNENVEKIIHIEDVPDDDNSSQSSYSIYKF